MPTWQEEQMEQQLNWNEEERMIAKQRSIELTARVAALRARRNRSRVQRLMAAVLAAAESGERDYRAERELAESGAGREAVEELVQVALENSKLEEDWVR